MTAVRGPQEAKDTVDERDEINVEIERSAPSSL